ncbi:MAG TPA: AsmA family protein, partial [Acetobacteraceae bacterium]|nr:AsmA family protein [Acetobacteraceae bacterium]
MKKLLLIIVLLLLALPLAAFAAAHFMLNEEALKTRIAETVRRATGRELTIAGPVQLAWSLAPTLEARDVSLANPPGMSRPAMAHADLVAARVAVLPLFYRRVEVRRVVVRSPDVLLERDAQGRANWDFSLPPPPGSQAPSAPRAGPRFDVAIGAVEISNARVALRQGRSVRTLTAPHLDYAPETGGVTGEFLFNGASLALSGTAGPIAGSAWPLDLHLTGAGLAAAVTGTTALATLSVQAQDLAAASSLAGRDLPPLHDVQLSATIGRSGLAGLRLQTGPSDLGGGLRLARLAGSAPAPDQPVTAQAELLVAKLPVSLSVKAASLSALLGHGPVPVLVLAGAGDAVLSGDGTIVLPRPDRLELTLSGRVPDAARLGALAGVALPAVKDVTLGAKLQATPTELSMQGLRLTSAQGDAAGDLALTLRPHPALRGSLVSQRLDLDAWIPPPLPASPTPAAAPAPAPAPAPRPERLIPDTKLPFALLRRADADLRLGIGEAVWRGTPYRSVNAVLALHEGRLRLDPVSLEGPGGPVQGQLAADATAQPPTLEVATQAPGLAAGPVLGLVGAPASTTGRLDLDLQLRGKGETLQALVATLDGHLGLALVEGEVENRWIAALLAETMRAAKLPFDPNGTSRVRCAAIRADASGGQVQFRALTLDTSKLDLEGEGGLDLANETVDLHLRPQLRLGTALTVPVRVSGPLRAPKVALDPGAVAPGRVGITIGGPAAPDT